jgi:hypothetical protein
MTHLLLRLKHKNIAVPQSPHYYTVLSTGSGDIQTLTAGGDDIIQQVAMLPPIGHSYIWDSYYIINGSWSGNMQTWTNWHGAIFVLLSDETAIRNKVVELGWSSDGGFTLAYGINVSTCQVAVAGLRGAIASCYGTHDPSM